MTDAHFANSSPDIRKGEKLNAPISRHIARPPWPPFQYRLGVNRELHFASTNGRVQSDPEA